MLPRHQDRDPLLPEPSDSFLQSCGRLGGKAKKRLIQEEQLGTGHQAAGYSQHLLLPAAQRPGQSIRPRLEDGEQPEGPL